ncbi:MAG: hypothetical protein JNM68_07600 [Dinghuibacter sp.]|nr:hypothetical protein [Dinghuibacter sp.]
MRSFLILLFGALVLQTKQADAQTINKLYGFWHVNHTGSIPVIPVPEEGNGNNVPPPKAEPSRSYYVYFESSTTRAPLLRTVSINGVTYKTTVSSIQQLPAVYEYFDGMQSKKITLVPKGRKHVFVVALTEKSGTVPFKKGDSELKVSYNDGKRTKTIALKKMTVLPFSVVQ